MSAPSISKSSLFSVSPEGEVRRAVTVATTAVRYGRVGAVGVLATRNMPAEGRRAAALDRAHHLELCLAHMAAVGFTPCGPNGAEDVRDF
jgi:hypothetical protein